MSLFIETLFKCHLIFFFNTINAQQKTPDVYKFRLFDTKKVFLFRFSITLQPPTLLIHIMRSMQIFDETQ